MTAWVQLCSTHLLSVRFPHMLRCIEICLAPFFFLLSRPKFPAVHLTTLWIFERSPNATCSAMSLNSSLSSFVNLLLLCIILLNNYHLHQIKIDTWVISNCLLSLTSHIQWATNHVHSTPEMPFGLSTPLECYFCCPSLCDFHTDWSLQTSPAVFQLHMATKLCI